VRRELETILALVDESTPDVAPPLRAVLSSVLVKVSRRASDTQGERVERHIGRGMAARLFAGRAEELARGLEALWRVAPEGTASARLGVGDARRVDAKDHSVGLIITSPPYAGTYDYLEHQAMRLAFLGMSAGAFEKSEIGARRRFRGTGGGKALEEWDRDMRLVISEMKRVLKAGGLAVLLVGDSLAGRVAVRADEAVERMAHAAGLEVAASASMPRTILGAAERAAFGATKREHLVAIRASDLGPRASGSGS
jgi:hypothetical protein